MDYLNKHLILFSGYIRIIFKGMPPFENKILENSVFFSEIISVVKFNLAKLS